MFDFKKSTSKLSWEYSHFRNSNLSQFWLSNLLGLLWYVESHIALVLYWCYAEVTTEVIYRVTTWLPWSSYSNVTGQLLHFTSGKYCITGMVSTPEPKTILQPKLEIRWQIQHYPPALPKKDFEGLDKCLVVGTWGVFVVVVVVFVFWVFFFLWII